MPAISRELLLYALSSALALALDLTLYRACLGAGTSVAAAAAAGFSAGLVLVYALSTRWVFREHRLADARQEFICFAAIGLVGLGLTEALLWLLVGRLQLAPMPAKLLTTGAVFLSNFTLRRQLLFTRRPRPVQAV